MGNLNLTNNLSYKDLSFTEKEIQAAAQQAVKNLSTKPKAASTFFPNSVYIGNESEAVQKFDRVKDLNNDNCLTTDEETAYNLLLKRTGEKELNSLFESNPNEATAILRKIHAKNRIGVGDFNGNGIIDSQYEQQEKDLHKGDTKQDGKIGKFSQGSTEDCTFLARLRNASKTPEGAKIIKDSITDNGDGTFSVKFKGAPDKEYKITEEELEANSWSKENNGDGTYTVSLNNGDGTSSEYKIKEPKSFKVDKNTIETSSYSSNDKDVRILEIAANKHYLQTQGKTIAGNSSSKNLITGADEKLYSIDKPANIFGEEISKKIYKEKLIKELQQQIPEEQLFVAAFQPDNQLGKLKTKSGITIAKNHAYSAERKGDYIFIQSSQDPNAKPVKVSIDEAIDKDIVIIK